MKADNSKLIVIGCAALFFNLLIGDILDIEKISDIFGRCSDIVTEFSRSPLLSQKLKKVSDGKVKTLKKHVKTRYVVI